MSVKPTEKPFWATADLNDPVTNAPNKKKPSAEMQSSGLKRKEPFLRSHLNWLFDNVARWIDYLDSVNSTITEDTTIYVSTAGDDTTGDGTVLSPFATPQRALDSLIGVPIATDALVTIFCSAGTYTLTEPVKLNHPYGERIHIIGDTLKSVAPTSAPIADWSLDKRNPSVPFRRESEFFNTAGTLSTAAETVTRQTAVSDDLVSNIGLVESRYSTIFHFQGCSGMVVDGNNSLGKLDKVVLKGDWDGVFSEPTTAKIGIDVGRSEELLGYGTSLNVTGGTVFLGKNTVIIGFHGEGCRVRYSGSLTSEEGISIINNYNNGARVEASSSFSANKSNIIGNGRHGVFTTGSSVAYLAGSLSTGNINNGCQAAIGSSCVVRDFTSCGNGSSGIVASIGSSLSFDNGISKGNRSSGITAITGSTCDGDALTLVDNGANGINCLRDSRVVGVDITSERNTIGAYADDSGTVVLITGSVNNNENFAAYAVRNSYIKLPTGSTSTGNLVTATKRSYINTGQVSGVVYSPSYGVVDSGGSLIGD